MGKASGTARVAKSPSDSAHLEAKVRGGVQGCLGQHRLLPAPRTEVVTARHVVGVSRDWLWSPWFQTALSAVAGTQQGQLVFLPHCPSTAFPVSNPTHLRPVGALPTCCCLSWATLQPQSPRAPRQGRSWELALHSQG